MQASSRSAVGALAAAQDGVVTRQQALACGLTPDEWRSGAGFLRRTGRGLAVLRDWPPSARQQARLASLAVGGGATVCLGTALRMRSIDGTPWQDPEHVLAGTGVRPRAAVVRHQVQVAASDVCRVGGIPATTPLRSVHDAWRTYDRAHAVSVLDSALHVGRVSIGELEWLATRVSRERAAWLGLVDGKAESPFETRMRLLLLDRGLAFRSQAPLSLPGFGPVRLDFLVGRRTAAECDGKTVHGEIKARYQDSARDEALRGVGIEAVHLAWRDVEVTPVRTIARLLAAEARGDEPAYIAAAVVGRWDA